MEIRAEINPISAEEKYREEICPLMSIANHETTLCVGWDCAMWVGHYEHSKRGITGHLQGHCGFVHPGHHNMFFEECEDEEE